MKRILVIERGSLRLVAVPGEPGIYEFLDLRHPEDARRVLEQYRPGSTFIGRLRQHLAEENAVLEPHRLSDDQVVWHVAEQVSSRRLPLARHEWEIHVLQEATEAPAPLPPAEQPKAKAEPRPEPEPPPDEVADTQPQVLLQAAQQGSPFCEECARAAAREAAAPNDQAQAQTLLEAAESGVPFCEECAKAKQAAARG